MRIARTAIIAVLAVVALPRSPHAAELGPTGHPRITYNVATSAEFGLPPDLAKVMALGSAGPDYFEFDNHAAHAQTPDLKVDDQGRLLPEEKARYRTFQKIAYRNAEGWHDLYFGAAVREAKKGHRERAALLLGYTLHNVQDFATHQGMTYVMHAGLARLDENPDQVPANLARATKMTALDLAEFHRRIGDENWRLFSGQPVRRPDGRTIRPEELVVFGGDLKSWAPLKEPLPRTVATKEDEARYDWAAELAVEKLERTEPGLFFKPDLRGRVKDLGSAKIKAGLALIKREEKMAAFLDVGQIPKVRAKHLRGLPDYVASLLTYQRRMPKAYSKLPAEDRKFLHEELDWHALNKAKLKRLTANRERYKRRLTKAVADPIYENRKRAWLWHREFERQWKPPPARDFFAPPPKPVTKKPDKKPEPAARSWLDALLDLFTPSRSGAKHGQTEDRPPAVVEREPVELEQPPEEEKPKECEGMKWVYTYEEEEYQTIQKVPKTVGFRDGEAIVEMRDDVVTRTRIVKEKHLVPCNE